VVGDALFRYNDVKEGCTLADILTRSQYHKCEDESALSPLMTAEITAKKLWLAINVNYYDIDRCKTS
jgi:hypothetical protein